MRKVGAKTQSRVAACLAGCAGLGFGLPGLYGTAYFARHGDVWHFIGFPTYGKGPFESMGVSTSVSLLTGFVVVCAAELLAAILLWKRHRAGLLLGLALLPVEVIFWIGFALPVGPFLGAGQTAIAVDAFRNHSAPMQMTHPSS